MNSIQAKTIRKFLKKFLMGMEYHKRWNRVACSRAAKEAIRGQLDPHYKRPYSYYNKLIQFVYEEMFNIGEFSKVVRISDERLVISE